jgi:hypothetical protein
MRAKPSYLFRTQTSLLFSIFALFLLIQTTAYCQAPGYDLATVWKYQAGTWADAAPAKLDFDDSSWKDIKLPEEKKKIREGWYRLWVDIPAVSKNENQYLSSEITFSRIWGNNEVFFNGELLGKQAGWGIVKTDRPASYIIPPKLIRFGQKNLITIHIKGYGGSSETGVTGKVMALSPLGGVWLSQQLRQTEERYALLLSKYPGAEYGKTKSAKVLEVVDKEFQKAWKSEKEAQWDALDKLIKQLRESLPAAEKKVESYWEKRDTGVRTITGPPEGWAEASPGFGILGRLYNDGLLTMNSDPMGFSLPGNSGQEPRVDYCGITPDHIWVKRMNWISKTMAIEGTKDGKPASYEVTHLSTFPGIMVKVFDKEFSFTFSTPSSQGPDYLGYSMGIKRSVTIPIKDEQGKLLDELILNPDKSKLPMQRNWITFWMKADAANPATYPLQICLEYPIEKITFSRNDAGKTVITLKSKLTLGNVVFLYPLGTQSGEKAFGQWRDKGLPADFMGVCDLWGFASRQLPIGCREFYLVDEAQNSVDIIDQYEYLYLDDEWNAGRLLLAPIPPVLSQAILNKYPVVFPQVAYQTLPEGIEFNKIKPGLNLLMKTKFGEYGTLIGTSNVQYRLPLPPLGEAAFLKNPASNSLMEKLINDSVKELGYPEAACAVDMAYKGNTQAWMAYPYLNPENREKLWKSSTTAALQAFREDNWSIETEPFTHIPYYFTYFLEGPNHGYHDIDWGNGLTLYGFQKYAAYSGDWKSVQANWDFMKKVYRYFPLADSWVWMSPTNADSGYGTGAGDCLCASYAASLSMARMAKVMKDTTQRNESLYLLAKAAVPVVARFWLKDYAGREGMLGENQYPIGYSEEEGILKSSAEDGPWPMTSMISGNGVEPELFELYMKYAPDALKQYEKDFEEIYPHWDDGTYQYNQKLTYPDNSGYITIPHLYNCYRLGYPKEILNESLHKASQSRKMWWVAPNVLAEMASSEIPLKLADWAPARWLGGEASADYKKVELYFQWDNREPAGPSSYFGKEAKGKGYDRTLEFNTRYLPYEVTLEVMDSAKADVQTPLYKVDMTDNKTILHFFQPERFSEKVKVSFKFYQ